MAVAVSVRRALVERDGDGDALGDRLWVMENVTETVAEADPESAEECVPTDDIVSMRVVIGDVVGEKEYVGETDVEAVPVAV